ncbi:hypothetical protein L596_000705 [Steinernema carpocapsae]|uniref:Uncharacterized protein n=1 Tax=Steinernema carpocapsae TaxID=34508 RepID=A0A4U8UIZ7_STECR|nr:hypothetical protein L596_000705 [Steinernema carpocapsae]
MLLNTIPHAFLTTHAQLSIEKALLIQIIIKVRLCERLHFNEDDRELHNIVTKNGRQMILDDSMAAYSDEA